MKISEKILMQAVALYEHGVPVSDIAQRFPDEAEELKHIFALIERLGNGKETVMPPKEVLAQILRRLPTSVPRPAVSRLAQWQIFIPIAAGAFALLIIFALPKSKTPLPIATTFSNLAGGTSPPEAKMALPTTVQETAPASAPAGDEFTALADEMNAGTPPDDTSGDHALTTLNQNNSTAPFDAAAQDTQI